MRWPRGGAQAHWQRGNEWGQGENVHEKQVRPGPHWQGNWWPQESWAGAHWQQGNQWGEGETGGEHGWAQQGEPTLRPTCVSRDVQFEEAVGALERGERSPRCENCCKWEEWAAELEGSGREPTQQPSQSEWWTARMMESLAERFHIDEDEVEE